MSHRVKLLALFLFATIGIIGCDKKSAPNQESGIQPVPKAEILKPRPFERDNPREELDQISVIMGDTKEYTLKLFGEPDVIRTEGGIVSERRWDEAWLYETKKYVYRVYFNKGRAFQIYSDLIDWKSLK